MRDSLKWLLMLGFLPTLGLIVGLSLDASGALEASRFRLHCMLQVLIYDVPRAFQHCPADGLLPVLSANAGIALVLALTPGPVFWLLARHCGIDRDRNAWLFPRLMPLAIGLTALTTLAQGLLVVLLLSVAFAWVLGAVPLLLAVGVLFCVGVSSFCVALSLRALAEPPMLSEIAVAVDAEEAPALWRLVEEVAGKLGSVVPQRLLLGLDAAFWVACCRVGTLDADGPSEHEGRIMHLPLPLLPFLEHDELAAVIAHELDHFRGDDVAYTSRFSPSFRTLEAAVGSMDHMQMPFEDLPGIGRIFGWVFRAPTQLSIALLTSAFHANVQAIRRLREHTADRAALEVVPPEVAAQALLRIVILGRQLDDAAASDLEAVLDRRPTEERFAAAFARDGGFGTGDPGHDRAEILAEALTLEPDHPLDSHPSTHARLAAIGVDPNTLSLDRLFARPAMPAAELLPLMLRDRLDLVLTKAQVAHMHDVAEVLRHEGLDQS